MRFCTETPLAHPGLTAQYENLAIAAEDSANSLMQHLAQDAGFREARHQAWRFFNNPVVRFLRSKSIFAAKRATVRKGMGL